MRGNATRAVGAAVTLLLAIGLGACSDDDTDDADGSTDTTASEDGGTAAFCEALADFNGATTSIEIDETSSQADIIAVGEQLAPLMSTIAENAPEDVSATADELNEAVQALLEGDAEPFNADETFATYGEFLGDTVGSCPFEQVEVTMVDYAFEGLPETLEAGTVAFALTNGSEAEEHEMIVMRRADGVEQSFEEILELPEEEAGSLVEFAGFGFAPPGGESATLVELTPGDYAVVCFIPVGGGEDGPPHFTQGMFQEFSVS